MLHRLDRWLGVLFLGLLAVPTFPIPSAQAQWQKLATFPGYISYCNFLNDSVGFIGLGMSPGMPLPQPPINLYRTTDGGATWKQATIPQGYSGEIADILMVDSINGWLAMTCYGGSGNKALWRTTDGGLSWNETALVGSGTSVGITPTAMIVTDLFNRGHVSTDGGVTFSDDFLSSTNCSSFVDAKHGVISDYRGENWLLTSDGGLTWFPSTMTLESWTVYGVKGTSNFYAAPEEQSYTGNHQTIVYKSTDYGAHWNSLASLPFQCTGHIGAIDGDQWLFFQVWWYDSARDVANHGGFYYSTDQGTNWTGIGGPSMLADTRFAVLKSCSGIKIYGCINQYDCTLYRYTIASTAGGPSELSLSGISKLVPQSCAAIDTAIALSIAGCISNPTLDSLWLTGSPGFSLTNTPALPRPIGKSDSIPLQYASTGNSDTTYLHLRYDLGSGARDTTLVLIGSPSPLASNPQWLHREAASAYFGQLDSLRMGVDINANVNLDSLWPYLSDIHATFAFDTSVVQFQSYVAPAGWTLRSFTNNGNSIDIGIHNSSSAASNPIDLGMALFSPNTHELATSWVTLPKFVLTVGGKTLSLCVTDNEDSHWAVKTLGAQSGVAESPASAGDGISIYPNPAESELFVRNSNARPITISIYDAIGRCVATANVGAASTGTVEIESLARGSYVVVCQVGDRVVTRRINKVQ